MKALLVVAEENGKLFAFDGQGFAAMEVGEGQPLVQYNRTRPADPARAGSWGDELVTDVTAVVRVAVRTMLRLDEDRAKFE